LEKVAEIFEQERLVPATIEFVDIAGLVRGASKGEGLGNQFLAAIREVDAILHVVRCFEDIDVMHVENSIDPARDVKAVEIELALADLDMVRRRREKLAQSLKSRSKEAIQEADALDALAAHLGEGKPARTVREREQILAAAQVFMLTDKPTIYLANTGEKEDESKPWIEALAAYVQGPLVALAGKLEADLAELDNGERAVFLEELDLSASGLERVIQACYEALDLVTFFTGVGVEARAWAVPRGTKMVEAAGRIHTDMERGYVKAEVIRFQDLAQAGSWSEAHRTGRVRVEGRDYMVQDGDVVLVRFNA